MGANSFVLKGWDVTLVSALFALATQNKNPIFIVIAILPALAFWDLDAYYLRQERLFRKLYTDVCLSNNQKLACDPFSMATTNYESQVPSWFRTLWTSSVLAIHGSVMIVILAVLVILLST